MERGCKGEEGGGVFDWGPRGIRVLPQGCRQPQLGPKRRSLPIFASQADLDQQSS